MKIDELKEDFLYALKAFEREPNTENAKRLKHAAARADLNKAVSIGHLVYTDKILKGY